MALRGRGDTKDRGAGVGWLEAALSNGCRQQVGERIPALLASLNPEEARAAAASRARVTSPCRRRGSALRTLSATIRLRRESWKQPPRSIRASRAGSPRRRSSSRRSRWARDNFARDPEVLLSVPDGGFAAAAVEAWLNSRFAPASRRGVAIESRLQAKLRFARVPRGIWPARRLLPGCAGGGRGERSGLAVPRGTHRQPGLLTRCDARARGTNAHERRTRRQPCRTVLGGDAGGRRRRPCHPQDPRELAGLRHAAEGGSGSAAVVEAEQLLRATPAQAQVVEARALLARAAATAGYNARGTPWRCSRPPRWRPCTMHTLALKVARELLAGEIQSDPQMFEAVAAAYAANKDFREASAQQRVAITKASALGWNTAAMQRRLSAYRADRLWTGDLFAAPAEARMPRHPGCGAVRRRASGTDQRISSSSRSRWRSAGARSSRGVTTAPRNARRHGRVSSSSCCPTASARSCCTRARLPRNCANTRSAETCCAGSSSQQLANRSRPQCCSSPAAPRGQETPRARWSCRPGQPPRRAGTGSPRASRGADLRRTRRSSPRAASHPRRARRSR